jgi:hypothetical protein
MLANILAKLCANLCISEKQNTGKEAYKVTLLNLSGGDYYAKLSHATVQSIRSRERDAEEDILGGSNRIA